MEKNNHHYVYVVACSDGTLYTGYTTNVERRIRMHNEGKGAKYTKYRRPVRLLYSTEYDSKNQALKAEYAFKQLSRIQKEQFLNARGIMI